MADNPKKVVCGRIELRDGTTLELPEDVVTRVVYALTTLAITPVIDHVQVAAAYDASDRKIWWRPQGEGSAHRA